MASSNFDPCLKFTLRYEGGFVNHPKDPGGATNLGITQATLAASRGRPVTVEQVRGLGVAEASEIYRKQYWNAVRGDELPIGVDLVVFDFAVNSGASRAAKALQAAVGVKQDGVIGMVTIAAVRKVADGTLVRRICENRLAFLQRLKTWSTFGKGWKARVLAVQKTALQMTAGAEVSTPVEATMAPSVQGAAKAPQTDVAPTKTPAGKGALTVAAGGVVGAAASAGELIQAGKSIQSMSDTLPIVAALGSIVVVIGITWVVWPQIKRLVRGQGKEEVE